MKDFNITKEDIGRLTNPSPQFRIFIPTQEKVEQIADWLYKGRLNLSDEQRNMEYIWKVIIPNNYNRSDLTLFYEIGDFIGVLGFASIIPGFKCDLVMKFWDKDGWSISLVKEARGLLGLIMDSFDLIRVNARTPDKRVEKMAHLIGFKTEGRQCKNFMWKENPMDLIILGLTR